MVASVTTIEGTRTYATVHSPKQQSRNTSTQNGSHNGHPAFCKHPGCDPGDRERRPDRDVDLSRDNDECHTDRDDQHRQITQEDIDEVSEREISRGGEREHDVKRRDSNGY
jgi:hypothetical protein